MKTRYVSRIIPLVFCLVVFSIGWAQETELPELKLSEIQQIESPQGYSEGLEDGSHITTSSPLWYIAGCLLPLPGVIIASAYSPTFNPDELRIISQTKGERYALGYAHAYEVRTKKKNRSSLDRFWNGDPGRIHNQSAFHDVGSDHYGRS